jgi:hypothetical protein
VVATYGMLEILTSCVEYRTYISDSFVYASKEMVPLMDRMEAAKQ